MDPFKSADGDKMIGDQSLDGAATGTPNPNPKLSDFAEKKESKEDCSVTKEEGAGNTDGEWSSLPNESQCSDGESAFLVEDAGNTLTCLEEPSEFDRIVSAIEDAMIDEELGEMQLAFADQYHRVNTGEGNHSDKVSLKNKTFEDYKKKLSDTLDANVQKEVSSFNALAFMQTIFSSQQSTDFEESEVYELLKTMYDLEAFEALVADYAVLVNSQDILSSVNVLPLNFSDLSLEG